MAEVLLFTALERPPVLVEDSTSAEERAGRWLRLQGVAVECRGLTELVPVLEVERAYSPRTVEVYLRDVTALRDHLREKRGKDVPLARLSAAAGSSRSNLRRWFERVYGVSPHRFQTSLRLRAAAMAIQCPG